MNAQDIQIFVRVVDRGSFAAVAEETGLTPSGISKIVSRLEDRLGVKLLQRTTRRLVLTQEGETYLIRGREILAAIEAAEAEITASRGRPRGLVRVNTGTAFGKHRLVRLLPEFRARYPEIEIDLSISDRRIDIVAEQIDVTVRVGPLSESTLIARRIGFVRRIITASPDYVARHGMPKKPADLLDHNCLLLTGFSRLAQWPMIADGVKSPLSVKGTITCDSADMLLDMAVAGLGIVRLGDFLGEDALADGRLVRLLDGQHDPDPSPITVLMLPGRQSLPRVRALVDFLAEKIGKG
jgi:DNA-binding transcriptional LysR family regulator